MTDSAESPHIGPDAKNAGEKKPAKKPATAAAQQQVEPDELSLSFETRYPGRTAFERDPAPVSFGPPERHLDDDDGPVIRRIPVASRPELSADTAAAAMPASGAPRLFGRQLDHDEHGHQPSYQATAVRRPAPPVDEWYDARGDAGYGGHTGNVDFSVAAIRAKRMRRPAGTHKPTSMATKATVFSLASVCLVAAGVSLGLYGQEMKYSIERQVELASVSVQDAWAKLASGGKPTLQPEQDIGIQANAAGGAGLTTGSTSPAPTQGTGRKLIYKRLPGAEQQAAAEQVQPVQQVQPAAANASADPFSQLLATPSDFANAAVKPD